MNTPKLPVLNSLEGVALAYLLTGKRISHLSFQGDTNSYCLRSPVCELRKAGFPIDDCWNAGSISRFSGRRTKYKTYFIRAENLRILRNQFGERVQKFIEAVEKYEGANNA